MSLPARLITQLLELVSSRLALAQIEIEEAQTLALRRLGWLLALGICSVLALQFGGLFLMLFYEGATRLWMVMGLAATFLLLAVIAFMWARKPLTSERFPELKAQIDSDARALR